MTKQRIQSIINLTKSGWRAYNEKVEGNVYERLGCSYAQSKGRNAPFWFYKENIFLCVGCSRGCTLSSPEGFVIPLPIPYIYKDMEPREVFHLTPQELVEKKSLLRVDEAAYCLNISRRLVRDWIRFGKLRRANDYPLRVLAEDVKLLMEDIEE